MSREQSLLPDIDHCFPFIYIRPKGHVELRNMVVSQTPTEDLVGFQPEAFLFHCNDLAYSTTFQIIFLNFCSRCIFNFLTVTVGCSEVLEELHTKQENLECLEFFLE